MLNGQDINPFLLLNMFVVAFDDCKNVGFFFPKINYLGCFVAFQMGMLQLFMFVGFDECIKLVIFFDVSGLSLLIVLPLCFFKLL